MKKGLITTLLAATASISGMQSVYAEAPIVNPLPDVRIGDAENNGVSDNNYFVYTNAFQFGAYASDPDGTPAAQLLWSFSESDATTTQWFQINGKNPLSVGSANLASGLAQAQRPDLVPNSTAPSSNNVVGGSKRINTESAPGYDTNWASFRDIVFSPGWGPLGSPGFPTPSPAGTVTAHAAGKTVQFFVSDGTNVNSKRSINVKSVDNASDAVSAPVAYQHKRDDTFSTGTTWWGKMQPGNANLTYDANSGSMRAFVPSGTGQARILGWAEGEYWTNILTPAQFPEHNELKYAEVGASNWIRASFSIFAQDASGGTNVTNVHNVPSLRVRIAGPLFSLGMFTDINPHRNGDAITDAYALDMTPTTSSTNARQYRVDLDPPEYNWGTTGYLFNSYVQNPNQLGFARMFEAFARGGDPQEQGYLCLAESSIGIYPSQNANMTTLLEWGLAAADWTTPASSILTPGGSFAEGLVFEQGPGGAITTQLGSHSTAAASTGDGAADVVTVGSATGFDLNTIAVDSRSDPDGAGKYAVASVNWYYGNAATGANTASHVRAMPNTLYRARFTAGATVNSSKQAMVRFRVQAVNSSFNSRLEVGGATGGTEFSWGLMPGVGSTYATGTGNSGVYDVVFATPFDINPADMSLTTGNHIGAQPPQGQPDSGSLLSFWREITPGADVIDEYIADPTKSATSDKGQMKITNIKIQSAPAISE
jgi:hypothetical protein